MSPNNEAIQLPPPMEQLPGNETSAETAPLGAEAAPSPERSAQSAPVTLPSVPAIPLPTPPAMPPAGGQPSSQDVPLQADDGDLIEKEWVSKAKQIVEQTRNDPYKQTEELTVFKADYMKKRYNKSIKVNK